jgi:hypothetical protein
MDPTKENINIADVYIRIDEVSRDSYIKVREI